MAPMQLILLAFWFSLEFASFLDEKLFHCQLAKSAKLASMETPKNAGAAGRALSTSRPRPASVQSLDRGLRILAIVAKAAACR